MFQAERNQCGSNFGITLKNFGKPKSICTSKRGDAVVAADEACDLGTAANTGSYGGCNANCTLAAYCGDKAISGAEQCDDGVNSNVYGSLMSGCAPGCKSRRTAATARWTLPTAKPATKARPTRPVPTVQGSGTAQCQPAAYCGDGVVNGVEACDEGQNNGGPTSKCDITCKVKCGNAVLDPG